MISNGTAGTQTSSELWDDGFDLIVLGAGAGGMTAALVGATKGLRVLLVEKSDKIGGTTALSSGTTWIPNNPHQRRLGVSNDAPAALQYLDALVGGRASRCLREAFIQAGPKMIQYLEDNTDVMFRAYQHQPDYRQDLSGAAAGGRPLEPLPFDGRLLGKKFDRVRWPIPEFTILSGMMLTRGEAALLLNGVKSWDAIRLAARLGMRHFLDRLHFKRGTRLVLGNALAARLYKGLLDHQVAVWFKATTSRLVMNNDRATGIEVQYNGRQLRVSTKHGIIMAGGGFPASANLRERFLPRPVAAYTAACEECMGETLQLAQMAGAVLGASTTDNALWFPSSVASRRDGTTAVYPHIVLDRPKPGLIAVNSAGQRFVNEAVSYHEFTRAMYESNKTVAAIPAWLICDRRFLWKYGLGMIRPKALSLIGFIKNGYLHKADTLTSLANQIGIDAPQLISTVRRHNEFARTGVDADFGKGGTIYELANGDANHSPNPCLAEIQQAPYYAVAVVPTPLGTSLGLRTSTNGEILNMNGHTMAGLYACGNDMNSIFGGEYPGAGAQIGPAMTFGYLAAIHAAGNTQS